MLGMTSLFFMFQHADFKADCRDSDETEHSENTNEGVPPGKNS